MFVIISEGLRIFKRNIRIKFYGFEKVLGTDEEICKKIIDSCWNGKYFSTCPKGGNYAFYSRDFGMCCESLINLGYEDKVHKTLRYAMEIFKNNNGIYVSINPSGVPFNFPNMYSPDSTAYFFRSLRIAKAKSLILENKEFLNSEIKKFENIVIDQKKGIVKEEHFSGMRDHVIVKRSCYDMIMSCMLLNEIEIINKMMKKDILDNTLKKYSLKKNFIKYYWKGYFKNSITDDSITGHCNIFPYKFNIIENRGMLKQSIRKIKNARLDKPFPLKYESTSKQKFVWQEFFVKGWESDTIWTFLAMPYIDILSRIDKKKAKDHLNQYKLLIEENGFVEVYDTNRRPYHSFFYSTETRMLWAAMYLDLKQKLK